MVGMKGGRWYLRTEKESEVLIRKEEERKVEEK
jgi:hypothetical protein